MAACLLLPALLMVVSEGRADTPSVVSANPHEDATLQCVNSNMINPKSCYRFRWMKISTDGPTEVILSWPKNSLHSNRVKLGVEGQMSLTLMNVEKSDEGLYSCEMCQGWNCSKVNTFLRVRDCKLLSPVMAAIGKPFKLDCPANVAQRPQDISWLLLKGSTAQPPDFERVVLNGTSLIIQSIMFSDSKWYRCNYTLTHRCYDIKVIVQDEETTFPTTAQAETEILHGEESRGTVAAAVSSVIIFLVLAAAVTGVLSYHFCKTRGIWRQIQGPPSGAFVNPEYDTAMSVRAPENLQDRVYEQCLDGNMWTFNI